MRKSEMPSSQLLQVNSSAATVAVLTYLYIGSSGINSGFNVKPGIQIKAPGELNFDYYQLVAKEYSATQMQIDIIHKFASNLLDNIKELDPEFSRTVDENLWDLI
jgi:hypothetical protein